jgi:hypothetical protein
MAGTGARTQTQLPLGTYLVVVDATDSGGTAITGLNQQWGFSPLGRHHRHRHREQPAFPSPASPGIIERPGGGARI